MSGMDETAERDRAQSHGRARWALAREALATRPDVGEPQWRITVRVTEQVTVHVTARDQTDPAGNARKVPVAARQLGFAWDGRVLGRRNRKVAD